jgi:DNA-binding HxlR family transcriptional regulator
MVGARAVTSGPSSDLPLSLGPILALLRRRHALRLLGVLHAGGTFRFNQLQRELGISPKSLQSLLTAFAGSDLVERVPASGGAGRSGYALTASGHGLQAIVQSVRRREGFPMSAVSPLPRSLGAAPPAATGGFPSGTFDGPSSR